MTVYGFNEDGVRRIRDMTRRVLGTPRKGAQRRRQTPILGGGASSGGIDLSCGCIGVRDPAELATVPIGSGFAMERYNVNFPGIGILTLFHDSGGVWSTPEFVLTCVTDPADERDVYFRMTVIGFGTKEVMLELVEVSSGDSLATWKNTTVGFDFNHATMLRLWDAKNIICPEVEWPCSLCVSALPYRECETHVCDGKQWVIKADLQAGSGPTVSCTAGCSWFAGSHILECWGVTSGVRFFGKFEPYVDLATVGIGSAPAGFTGFSVQVQVPGTVFICVVRSYSAGVMNCTTQWNLTSNQVQYCQSGPYSLTRFPLASQCASVPNAVLTPIAIT